MYGTANLEHTSADLAEKIDRAVGEAVRRVEARTTEKEVVTLTFTIALGKDGSPLVVYQRKTGQAVSGSWTPALSGQTRLELPDVPGSGVRGVTLTVDGGGRSAERMTENLLQW